MIWEHIENLYSLLKEVIARAAGRGKHAWKTVFTSLVIFIFASVRNYPHFRKVKTISKLSDVFPLPDEAKKLRAFGNWTVEGALTFMSKPFGVKGSAMFSSAAAGWGVLAVAKLDTKNSGAYEEVDILGFSRGEKMFHFFSVTNTAAVYYHRGRWLDENTLSFFYEGLQDRKTYCEEIDVKFQNANELAIHEIDSLDGQAISTMDVTLRK